MQQQDRGTMWLAVFSVGFMATLLIIGSLWIIAAWLFGHSTR